jgi:hypothetical protein
MEKWYIEVFTKTYLILVFQILENYEVVSLFWINKIYISAINANNFRFIIIAFNLMSIITTQEELSEREIAPTRTKVESREDRADRRYKAKLE